MSDETAMWKAKLAARIHDPAEKALVLLRDPAGHEGGTSKAMARLLGLEQASAENIDPDEGALSTVLFETGISRDMYRHVQRADWWAAAADRPQWPMEEIQVTTRKGATKTLKVADWAQVRWFKDPVLIHPLSGQRYRLPSGLGETDVTDIKHRSRNHLSSLLATLERHGGADFKRLLLTWWRFGSEVVEEKDAGRLGELWRLLPADTRVPDHSIWDHLDLTSAFTGAFAADEKGEAALLSMSIGPVQSFIAAARSTSDLWAGSHLLARLAWEAMKVVCDALGPDAILLPRLRGVPQVDLWLRDECKLPPELFNHCEWQQRATDSNPLFAAALPNRFVAIVPQSQAASLAGKAEAEVRRWFLDKGNEVVDRLLEEAGIKKRDEPRDASVHAYRQLHEQLVGFPEVHWAAVPFSLVRTRNPEKQTDLDVAALSEAMAPFFGASDGEASGFLQSAAWQVLKADLTLETPGGERTVFFAPNPGVLYPAVHELAERVLAAAKSVRPFGQIDQIGWRCSLTGEVEWLTTDPTQLLRSYRQQQDTLWWKIAAINSAWAKRGEHLGALSAIKRLWPTLFAEEVGAALGLERGKADRFVVSTHTMALAANLDKLNDKLAIAENRHRIALHMSEDDRPPALPPALARLRGSLAACIPAALDRLRNTDGGEVPLRRLESELESLLGFRPEAYYALLLMDGDHMGKILSGEGSTAISYLQSFHPQLAAGFGRHAAQHALVQSYGACARAVSPNRHLAISGALNDFSLTVARYVIEREHRGRIIYAGGDDVLAMLPVSDLLSAMQRLRHAYSGHDPDHAGGVTAELTLHEGFALLEHRLMRMMGKYATASCGAVIAHHQAPLSGVLRELRAAEARAKNGGGRDAFSLTVIKRSGGSLELTEKWGRPAKLLQDVRLLLADEGVSRRAVYNSLEWLKDIPEPTDDGEMLESLLCYQLTRQADAHAQKRHPIPELAERLTALAISKPQNRLQALQRFLSVAEFLARESRGGEA